MTKRPLFQADFDALTALDRASAQENLDRDEPFASDSHRKRAHSETHSDKEYEEHDVKRARATGSGLNRVTRKEVKGSAQRKDSEPSVVNKRARKIPVDDNFKKVRGKLGFLDKLVTDVPLEVIFEVFSYLKPLDILRLARTSKELRNILMSKSSEPVWRTARLSVENLPPLPQDLNEPQYTNLMFEPHCHSCLHKSRCEYVVWEYRLRCCRKCELKLFNNMRSDNYGGILQSDSFMQIKAFLPSNFVSKGGLRTWVRGHVYMPSVVKQYVSEFEATGGDTEKRVQWLEERKRNKKALEDHVELCREWHEAQLRERESEISEVRRKRLEDILNKLEETGWADEARKMIRDGDPEFTSHKFVNQPMKLTARAWELMEQPLVSLLRRHKAHAVREHALRSRYTLLNKMYTDYCGQENRLQTALPGLGDLYASKLFDHLIWGTPFDEELTSDHFSGIFAEKLPTFIVKWRTAREDELLEVLRREVPAATKADLRLALTIFTCARVVLEFTETLCYEPLWYPKMFFHHHKRYRHAFTDSPTNYRTSYVKTEIFDPFTTFGWSEWDPNNIKYFAQGSQTMRTIVEACGLDPTTATFEDLTAADPLIECDEPWCQHSNPRYKYFFRWLKALGHINHKLLINSFGEFGEEILAVSRNVNIHAKVRCKICDSLMNGRQFETHFSNSHGLPDEHSWRHWYCDPESSIGEMDLSFRFVVPERALQSSSSTS